MVIYMIRARNQYEEEINNYDIQNVDLTDFAIMVQNIGLKKNVEYKPILKETFENIIPGRKCPVVSVNLSYTLSQ